MCSVEKFQEYTKQYKYNAFECDVYKVYSSLERDNYNVSYWLKDLITSNLSDKHINLNKPYVVYFFLRDKNEIIDLGRLTQNIFLSFMDEKRDFNYLKKILSKISAHKNLKLSDFTIEFYVFQKSEFDEKDFYKIYQLIYDAQYNFRKEHEESRLGDFFSTMFYGLFMESFKFLSKHFIVVFVILTLYVLNFYRYELYLLGYPYEFVTDLKVMSVIKLFSYAISLPIIIAIVFCIWFFFAMSARMSKSSLFKPLKFSAVLISFGVIFSVLYQYNILNADKRMIDETSFVLNHYLADDIFPRVLENNDSTELVIATSGKEMYSFNLEKLINGIDKKKYENNHTGENNISKLSLERLSLSILKYSSYADPKNLDTKPKMYHYLDRNESTEKLKFSLLKR